MSASAPICSAHDALVADDRDVARSAGPLDVEHRPVRRKLVVDREHLVGPLACGVGIVRDAHRQDAHDPRRRAARFLGRRRQLRDDVGLDRRRPRHPQDRAVGDGPGEVQHPRRHRREVHGHRVLAWAREAEMGRVRLARVAHVPVAQQRQQDVEVVAHVAGRLVERVAEHPLDDDLVRQADAERETSVEGGLRRHRLLGQRRRMTRIRRDHGRAEFEPRHVAAGDREGRRARRARRCGPSSPR